MKPTWRSSATNAFSSNSMITRSRPPNPKAGSRKFGWRPYVLASSNAIKIRILKLS